MNFSKIDNRGNIISGTTAILVVAMILIVIFVINSLSYIENENTKTIEGENLKYIVDDYGKNIEILARESLSDAVEKVFRGHIILNSRNEVKKILNEKLDKLNEEYKKKYDADIQSEVVSVEPSSSPWKVEFKVHIIVSKDDYSYDNILVRNASIEGLKDPLPYTMINPILGVYHDDTTVQYFKTLTMYLFEHGVDNPKNYFDAKSPLYIKKCPYDPYIHHGDGDTLKECLKNGYFHESSDGSCFLCRLGRQGSCPHYGLETFIQTHTDNDNETVSCIDHVVFHDRYNGEKLTPGDKDSLFLDSSHRKKYGLV